MQLFYSGTSRAVFLEAGNAAVLWNPSLFVQLLRPGFLLFAAYESLPPLGDGLQTKQCLLKDSLLLVLFQLVALLLVVLNRHV